MLEQLKEAIGIVKELSGKKPIKIISHFDTDGITSAAIFSRALQRAGIKFSLQITKSLEKDFIEKLPENHFLIFLDLASGSLDYLKDKKTEILILDHHEIEQEIPPNVFMVNPSQLAEDNCSSAAICYLFAKLLSEKNKDLSNLAVLGMVGDQLEKNLTKTYREILEDSEVQIKKGLLLYPATRPIDRVLEYSSGLYIPEVTGSFKGVNELLREARIERQGNAYKSLVEFNEEEMSNLITAIMLRQKDHSEMPNLIGNIYLIKFFNKLEDAREISASINACSRMGNPQAALGFCLGNKKFKEQAEEIYIQYRQNIAAAMKYISETEKITGKNYTIINAQDKIKDTIVGTVASIMSFSPLSPQGNVIIAMAYDQDKIKVSARICGKKGRNVRELLTKAVIPIQGEVGGHPNAAGALIPKEKELEFLTELKRILEIELVKV